MAGRGSEQLPEFLDESKIRIGFSHDASLVEKGLDAIRDALRKDQPDARPGQIIASASQLNRFLHEISIGDKVLIFEAGTRLYHIGEITSAAMFEVRDVLPYTRNVRWIGTISRDHLSVSARNALGAILTLFSVNEDVQREVEEVLAGKKNVPDEETEEDIEEEGEEVSEKAREFLKDKIQELSWDQMQELVAGLLRSMGYKTKVSPSGADRGKDIVASPDGLGLEEPRIHVEVKHRNGQIGAPAIRAFAGGLRRSKGIYVSTGGFTREAQYEAERSDSPITLVDIDEFANMIIQYYDQFDTEARALLPLKKIYWPI